MGIDHQVVFASDNGDVDIFKKKIGVSFLETYNEFKRLKNIIDQIDLKIDVDFEYLTDLQEHLSKISEHILQIKNECDDVDVDLTSILESIVEGKVKKAIEKIYNKYECKSRVENVDKILILELLKTFLKKSLIFIFTSIIPKWLSEGIFIDL